MPIAVLGGWQTEIWPLKYMMDNLLRRERLGGDGICFRSTKAGLPQYAGLKSDRFSHSAHGPAARPETHSDED